MFTILTTPRMPSRISKLPERHCMAVIAVPPNQSLHRTLDSVRLALPLQAVCVKCR